MVAQVKPTALEAHRRSIRVGGADPLIGAALIEAVNLALLPTFLPDPVVLCREFGFEFLALWLGEDNGQRRRRRSG